MNVPTAAPVELAEPGFPMAMLMVSEVILPDPERTSQGPLLWVVGKPHPFVPNANVLRMFVTDSGVDVYSVSSNGMKGMRDRIPMTRIRLVQEAMPLEVFAEELDAAEDDNYDNSAAARPDEDNGDGDGDAPIDPNAPSDPAAPALP